MLFGEDVCVLDKNFRHIATIEGMQLAGRLKSNQQIILCDEKYNNYTVTIASYDEIIATADEMLGSYRPDESITEQYGLAEFNNAYQP